VTGDHTGAPSTDPIAAGLDRIREEQQVPGRFPSAVLHAAEEASRRGPGPDHVDRTDRAFVTLDPASSTDLDQAFAMERAGDDIVLHYAIADVGWFVRTGDPVDVEAWQRGVTLYLPDGRSPLHPPVLSEAAASLLPDGDRPAVVFTVRLDTEGGARLDGVERALIRSRAKLAYDSVELVDLPEPFADFSSRMVAAENARGAGRVEFPDQEVERTDDGDFELRFRPRRWSEDANAALSLATNLAVADTLHAAGTGLFRVMSEPDERTVRRLRHSARALGLDWPGDRSLAAFERTVDGSSPAGAAFLLAVRRAGGAASYEPFREGVVPWHAAMAATYAHATAPLRRLADRYVVEAALAVANGRPVADDVRLAFDRLPDVMGAADARANRVDRAVVDLVEAVVLERRVGRTFEAVVTDLDERGARIQLCEVAVVARVNTDGLEPGEQIRVKLTEASPDARQVRFERVA
jgi:exoribonuclease R